MIEADYLKLILEGQKATGDKVDTLVKAVVRLETINTFSQQSHAQCRSEVDAKIDAHIRDNVSAHEDLADRLRPIEEIHLQQTGGVKASNIIWKAITGVLGLTLITMGILGYAGVFS
jgi:hypothetical protein